MIEILSSDAYDILAERLRALGHPARIAIVRALAEQDCCCGEVCRRVPAAQSTVSQHLKVLRDAGLLTYSKNGTRSCYGLDRSAFADLERDVAAIVSLVRAAPDACRTEEDFAL
jgi:ArsR family transcriptional regulator, arsenate/arsenite/antimonite-responsive transcriptional repressor